MKKYIVELQTVELPCYDRYSEVKGFDCKELAEEYEKDLINHFSHNAKESPAVVHATVILTNTEENTFSKTDIDCSENDCDGYCF